MLRAMRLLYTLLLYLLVPFVLLRLLWRGLELRDYWHRWNERFGFVERPAQDVAVWVHAVSVGESLAALPLMIPVSEALVWIIGIDAAFVYFGYLLVTWFQANPLF